MTDSRSYRGLVDQATQQLFATTDTPRIDAEVLMLHVLTKPLAWLIAHGDAIALPIHVRPFFKLVEQRQQGQPIAYLTGQKEFWSLTLKVSSNVLIPRSDTEILVEQALSLLGPLEQSDILDLGTGSGAIALALAKELPNADVLATDASCEALAIARENATNCGITNVRFQQSNWYRQIGSTKFDLIASNPPYIEAGNPHLSEGDLRFEPISALVSDDDGLGDLRAITRGARRHLKHNGHLIVEHGFNQSKQVQQLFEEEGLANVQLFHDLNELPRCTVGQMVS